MKYRHFTYLAFCSLLLSACATPKPPPALNNTSGRDNSLAEASYAVSRSIVDLAETAQAAHPTAPAVPAPSPASYGMGGITSVDWSGPVEPLVKQIARASNYRVRVLGREPAIPVLVTVNTRNAMLGDILRDVGYQCGERATVLIFPESRVIELRYAKS
jgi:defect-in-organelle-trafficking protein DotD